jgi:tetratricopeptide (TPR) repeat protein
MRRLATLVVLLSLTRLSLAGNVEKAKEHYENGIGAYALGRYEEAAQEYEKAFALKPDPALLYNAAQSHRLAGNKTRALLLYSNLLRRFAGRLQNKEEVQRHVAALKEAIESEKRATTQPPTEPQTVKDPYAKPEPVKPEPVVAQPVGTAPAVVVTHEPKKKTPAWVWGVVGGGIAVALGVGLGVGLALGLPPGDPPEATFGVARVR